MKNNPQISVARLDGAGVPASHPGGAVEPVADRDWETSRAWIPRTIAVSLPAHSTIPIIYQRAAAVSWSNQLITDFGRTTNLISSASLTAKAEDQNARQLRKSRFFWQWIKLFTAPCKLMRC